MGDAPPLDEDAPDEALLAEDGRSSPTSVGRVRKRAQIGAQLARGWERGVALLRRRLARSCCCPQTRSGSTSARLRGWGGETTLAGTRIAHHPPTSARTMPPSHLTAKRHRRRTRRRRAVASQTTSAMRPPRRRGGRRVPAAGPSSVAGPARPSWPARLPTREDRAGGQILGKMALFANPSRRLNVGTSRIDDSPPAPACAPCNSIQNRHVVRLLNRSWRGATAIPK